MSALALGSPTAGASASEAARCRACGCGELRRVLDLGLQPEASRLASIGDPSPDPVWPLVARICPVCGLVQLGPESPPEPSEVRGTGVASVAATAAGDRLTAHVFARRPPRARRLVHVASHGGYLGRVLTDAFDEVVTVGAEPPFEGVADADLLAPAVVDRLVAHGRYDVFVDSYLLAHVADLDAYAEAIDRLLVEDGRAFIETDHLLPLVETARFDAIRHGHFAYPSLAALEAVFARHGLQVTAAEPQRVYGGTLRLDLARPGRTPVEPSVAAVRAREAAAGLTGADALAGFAGAVAARRRAIREVVTAAVGAGRTVAAYGAPSRGTTLLNACGLGRSLVAFTVDASAAKQGRAVPGVRVPILAPAALTERRVDDVLVLTWDLRAELAPVLEPLVRAGRRLIYPLPELELVA